MEDNFKVLPVEPAPLKRPRTFWNDKIFNKKTQDYGIYQTYVPTQKKHKGWRERMQYFFMDRFNRPRHEVPIRLKLKFYNPDMRSDLSNLLKNAEEALEGFLYHNDNQIKSVTVDVLYQTGEPYIEMAYEIIPWEEVIKYKTNKETQKKIEKFSNNWRKNEKEM